MSWRKAQGQDETGEWNLISRQLKGKQGVQTNREDRLGWLFGHKYTIDILLFLPVEVANPERSVWEEGGWKKVVEGVLVSTGLLMVSLLPTANLTVSFLLRLTTPVFIGLLLPVGPTIFSRELTSSLLERQSRNEDLNIFPLIFEAVLYVFVKRL